MEKERQEMAQVEEQHKLQFTIYTTKFAGVAMNSNKPQKSTIFLQRLCVFNIRITC